MKILCFDPGRTTGWACFDTGELFAAGIVKVSSPYAHPQVDSIKKRPNPIDCEIIASVHFAERVLIETPRWYGQHNRVDANDLIDLAIIVGEIRRAFMQFSRIDLIYPRDWKGTIDGDVHNRRVVMALSQAELGLLPKRHRAKGYDHNMLDAIGLGLWHLNRIR